MILGGIAVNEFAWIRLILKLNLVTIPHENDAYDVLFLSCFLLLSVAS